MPDQPSNIRPIDPVAHSAARDPHVLELHEIVMEPDRFDDLEGPAAHHKLSVVLVRDEASDALRAAADWIDEHPYMYIDAIAIEQRSSRDGKELTQLRFFVDRR